MNPIVLWCMVEIFFVAAVGSLMSAGLYYIFRQCSLVSATEDSKAANKHITLTQQDLKQRVIIIGDIHGCLDELKLILERAEYDASNMTVVLVGDLVNKGPFSNEVVQYVKENGFHCVLGNHDLELIKNYHQYMQGEPIKDKYAYAKRFSPADIAWLESLPFTISLPDLDAIVVHAGLIPQLSLDKQSVEGMTKMRNIYRGSEGMEALERNTKGENWASFWTRTPHVYYGHDAKRGFQQHDYATGLDTGCCYGRKLTGVILPEREFIEVEALQVYQDPEDKKRKKH